MSFSNDSTSSTVAASQSILRATYLRPARFCSPRTRPPSPYLNWLRARSISLSLWSFGMAPGSNSNAASDQQMNVNLTKYWKPWLLIAYLGWKIAESPSLSSNMLTVRETRMGKLARIFIPSLLTSPRTPIWRRVRLTSEMI
ncbi:hypothetical protein PVAP13_8NG155202 [Panicum virgatum]|uniref:Uncharacterized protein n=1 Tax=Panicum virgatum TaxID=38727 RepID=A0A8T0P7P9_PANVG|nr:hypothetical protein PVAP13_8NG155202 [Panicum virgatum]